MHPYYWKYNKIASYVELCGVLLVTINLKKNCPFRKKLNQLCRNKTDIA